MDSDAAPTVPVMPRSTSFEPTREPAREPARSEPGEVASARISGTAHDRADRNGVFAHLVKDDGDIAGLVAYSIYKQHKLDWLRAFEAAKGRAPDDNELAAYIIGEGTPRRLATYRHLAEATLAGEGPEVDGVPAARSPQAGRRARASLGDGLAAGMIALYAAIAVLFILGFYLALHYTGVSR